jgi:hypothetical protein
MNGKIDKEGVLKIQRGKSYKGAICVNGPKTDLDRCAFCRDSCSHFGEPKTLGEPIKFICGTITELQLCQRTLVFDELLDERE